MDRVSRNRRRSAVPDVLSLSKESVRLSAQRVSPSASVAMVQITDEQQGLKELVSRGRMAGYRQPIRESC